ncbi:MAG: sugar transferase [Clostridia bacterium]|nr:sugar transferase [Clostridia bacterium]
MYKYFFKRLFDILFCLIILPVLLLFIILLSPIIFIDDPGPVFYVSKRVGKNGKIFGMLKFRSMKVNSPNLLNKDGSTYNSPTDKRQTRVGKVLRMLSIDELPQFLNVLAGQMTLIGPRPVLDSQLDSFNEIEREKLKVLPGITGYCQAYHRNQLPSHSERMIDAWYANNVSFKLDVKILFKTVLTVLKPSAVYRKENDDEVKPIEEKIMEFNRKIAKHILVLNGYYAPEVAASMYLEEDIVKGFCSAGFKVSMLVPTPSRGLTDEQIKLYRKKEHREEFLYNDDLRLQRYKLYKEPSGTLKRFIRYFIQNKRQYKRGVRVKDADYVFCGSTPPTQGLTCAKIAKKLSKKYKRKVPFIYNLQDIFPDSLVNAGLTKKGSLIWKIGRKIENKTYAAADKIIVISESFKNNLLEKGVPEEKIEVVYNWVDPEKVKKVEKEDNKLFDEMSLNKKDFHVVYAGNFGVSQGIETIIQAAKLLKDENQIKFVLFGGGAEYERIKAQVEDEKIGNVLINRLLPEERISEVYSLGDVSLITCKKGAGSSAMPSKTWSIMACESPIIAAFDKGSELEAVLNKAHAGVCVEPENPKELAQKIKDFYELKKIGTHYVSGGREFVNKNASAKTCVSKYIQTLTDIIK